MSPSVLIIILNYKTYRLTLDVLQKIGQLKYSHFDVLVIDNHSPNESFEILSEKSRLLGYKFISNSKNLGYAGGNNIGIHYAIENGYQYSFLINNDLRFVDFNILNVLVETAQQHPEAAVVGPQIENLDGKLIPPYVASPTIWNMTLGLTSTIRHRYARLYESGRVYRVYGCCMLIDNKKMQQVGLFDERTFLYYEEDILAEKFLKKHYSFYYCAETKVVHLESMTVKDELGKVSIGKIRTILKSYNLYLHDYLHYNIFARIWCLLFKCLLIILR